MPRPRTWPALLVRRVAREDLPDLTDDELALAALDELGPSACDRADDRSWRIFFPTLHARDAARSALAAHPAAARWSVTPLDVPDEGWAERSQRSLRAVTVGAVTVAPPWDVPRERGRGRTPRQVVVIEPSMGFGTGHHESTRLCLAALQRVDLRDQRVLDLGTGSGVLAIAARLRGAVDVVGVDTDSDALDSARRNLALNPEASGVHLERADVARLRGTPADVVVANLTAEALVRLHPSIRRLLAPRGRLIASGYLAGDEARVLAAFGDLQVMARDEESGWVAHTLTR